MTLNHSAIRRAYPNAITIDDGAGVFDAKGNRIELDATLVDAAAIVVAQEQDLATIKRNRSIAFAAEADPLFFKAQRGEATMEEWQAKVEEIRARFPFK